MHAADRPSPVPAASRGRVPWCCFLAGIVVALCCCRATPAQDQPPLLRLGGFLPAGVRNSATESWGTFEFNLTNFSDNDRQARVLMFYEGQPDVQYGRDVWVPARASITSWLLVGPAPAQSHANSRDVQVLLYDRTGGQDHLVLPPGTERVRSRGVLYRKREPFTAIVLDEEPSFEPQLGQLPQPETHAEEAVHLARVWRNTRGLSGLVQTITPGALPPTVEGFDGLDHVVLASERLADDPPALQALRQWLERGGRLWVMLDLVGREVLAPLLGEALDFRVVDRVGLTEFHIDTFPGGRAFVPRRQQHERPVDLVRVLLPPGEPVRQAVNGWPAWFSRQVGRGKVVFTTVGPRGWYRPRKATDEPSPYANFPGLPVATTDLDPVSLELQPPAPEDPAAAEAFGAPLTEEIGYTVISRGAVALVIGTFLLGVFVLGLVVRRSRRPELFGWLAPAAALLAAAVLVSLGAVSRRAAVPTLAVTQVVNAVAGTEEVPVRGPLAVYRPDSGAADLGAEQGGLFDLDMSALEGQTRRFILSDLDAWHWENLALPAGVRSGSFRLTTPTREPLAAVAQFGPEGLEGKLASGPFRDLADALLVPPSGRNLAVHLGPEGAFSTGSQDVLPAGQFLTGTVLSDRQQRRQGLYREFLKRSLGGRQDARPLLLAWAEPVDPHITLGTPDARTVGNALLVVPLRLQRPTVGALATIPGPLVPYHRILNDGLARPTLGASTAVDQHLRFQLPDAVLPFRVERARLTLKVNAPSRQVIVAAWTEGGHPELRRLDSPVDPTRVDITDERFLHLDAEGGLHLNLAVSEPPPGEGTTPGEEKWNIDYLELEVTGRTQ
jgi:hypothetical protein